MDQNPKSVPWRVFEEVSARNSVTIRRLTGIIILLVVLLFVACTAVGLVTAYYESQMETVQIEQDTDGGGNNNFIGGDGQIHNGGD